MGRSGRPPHPSRCIQRSETPRVPTKSAATATALRPLTSTGRRSHPIDRPSRVYTRLSSPAEATRQYAPPVVSAISFRVSSSRRTKMLRPPSSRNVPSGDPRPTVYTLTRHWRATVAASSGGTPLLLWPSESSTTVAGGRCSGSRGGGGRVPSPPRPVGALPARQGVNGLQEPVPDGGGKLEVEVADVLNHPVVVLGRRRDEGGVAAEGHETHLGPAGEGAHELNGRLLGGLQAVGDDIPCHHAPADVDAQHHRRPVVRNRQGGHGPGHHEDHAAQREEVEDGRDVPAPPAARRGRAGHQLEARVLDPLPCGTPEHPEVEGDQPRDEQVQEERLGPQETHGSRPIHKSESTPPPSMRTPAPPTKREETSVLRSSQPRVRPRSR